MTNREKDIRREAEQLLGEIRHLAAVRPNGFRQNKYGGFSHTSDIPQMIGSLHVMLLRIDAEPETIGTSRRELRTLLLGEPQTVGEESPKPLLASGM